jgi:hypothetical protein
MNNSAYGLQSLFRYVLFDDFIEKIDLILLYVTMRDLIFFIIIALEQVKNHKGVGEEQLL